MAGISQQVGRFSEQAWGDSMRVVGVEDLGADASLRLHIESPGSRPVCERCGTSAEIEDRPQVEPADLPAFGRPVRTVRHTHRWRCPHPECPMGSRTAVDQRIAFLGVGADGSGGPVGHRQVGECGRTMAEMARGAGV